LLEFLPVLLLLRIKLVLLLLIFLVCFVVSPCRLRTLDWRQVVGMSRVVRARHVPTARVPGPSMYRTALSSLHHAAFSEAARSRSRSNPRLAMVCRRSQIGIRSCCLHLFPLAGHRRNMPLVRCPFFLRRRARVNSAPTSVVADACHVSLV